MENELIRILETRPELTPLLIIAILLIGLFIVSLVGLIVGIFVRKSAVSKLLDNELIKKRIMDEHTDLAILLPIIVNQALEVGIRKDRTRWYQKMFSDITWDVSGLIEIIVTIVLMVMIVSRSFENVPKEFWRAGRLSWASTSEKPQNRRSGFSPDRLSRKHDPSFS